MRKHSAKFVLLMGAFLIPAGGFGLVVEPQDVQSALGRADLVARIEIESVTPQQDPQSFCTFRAGARIIAVEKARGGEGTTPAQGDRVEITGPGCEVGDKGIFLSGFPRPRRGVRYRAYLNRAGNDYTIAGFDSGLLPLTKMRQFSRNRTDGSNGEGTGAFLYWDKTYFPIPYFISQPTFQYHPDFVLAIDASFKTWRNVEDLEIEFVGFGCTSSTKNENDGVNNVILITDKWPFDPAAIAITRNFYVAGQGPKSGLILDSDILLNAVDHKFTTTNESGKHDVQNIVTHEVGHFLGLGHEVAPVDPEATMYAVASPNEFKKRDLHSNDLFGIHAAYGGAGTKLAWHTPSCEVADVATSCGAVHTRRSGTPWGVYALFGMLLLNVSIGRFFFRRQLPQG